MKVLHVVTGLGVGGAELQLRGLLRVLPQSVRSDVVALTNPGAVADGILADGTAGVTHLGMRGNRDLSALPRLVKLIRRGRYDVVHTHLYRACVYGRPAARLAGVRGVVATEHSLGESQIEGRPLTRGTRTLYRATERLGAGTFAVSGTVARRLRDWGVPEGRIHLAPNGIEPDRFRFDPAVRAATRARLGLPANAYVVGGVGRLVTSKRFDVLLHAVAAAPPHAHALVAGAGPERAALGELATALGIAGRTHILSATDGPPLGVPELLAAIDLFVSPSAEESFGLAVLEALAAGLPVLHAACPAVEDLPAADAPGARLVSAGELDAAVAAEVAAGPRRLPVPPAVGQYHIARTADLVMDLYTRVTEHRTTTTRTSTRRTVEK
ncbi:glycosyltransferase [Streptomyces sp. CA-111067]|uniref:glycosyltransferase n=1 Tax=Streptomyces sp. CA-111067 TaxID=3240046 RepID=UPI003D974AF1